MKYCIRCEQDKELDEFYKNKQKKDGYNTYCKLCSIKYNKEHDSPQSRLNWRQNNKDYNKKLHKDYYEKNKKILNEQSKKFLKTPHGKFLAYKNGAKKRNIEFLLSVEQFNIFWNQNCSYCNDEIETIGIDRRDSNKGYILENCTPCCAKCNQIKMDLTYDDFINKIIKIYTNLKLKNKINEFKTTPQQCCD